MSKKRRQYRSLHEWLDRTGTPQRILARLSGISEQQISNLLRGSRRVSLAKALKLEEVTGVPVKNLVEWPKIHESRNSGEAA